MSYILFQIEFLVKMNSALLCTICEKEIYREEVIVKISQKGTGGVNEDSRSRKSDVVETAGIIVHTLCGKFRTKYQGKVFGYCEFQLQELFILYYRGKFVFFSSKRKPNSEYVKLRTPQYSEAKKCRERRYFE